MIAVSVCSYTHSCAMCLMFPRVFQCGADGQWIQRIQEDRQHTLLPHCQSEDIQSVNDTLITQLQLIYNLLSDVNAKDAPTVSRVE